MTEHWVVSSFTVVSWQSGRAEITSAATGATFTAEDIGLIRLIHAFARPRTIEAVLQEFGARPGGETAHRIADFIRGGILTSSAVCEEAETHHWDWSALACHRRSRRPGFVKSSRPMAITRGTPASEVSIALTPGPITGRNDLPHLLEERRSHRCWPAVPIDFLTFSAFLWLSARDRWPSEDRVESLPISRPYPSGGAAYSLEIYPVLGPDAVQGITAGLYRYRPDLHGLDAICLEGAHCAAFLAAAGQSAGSAPPPIVLLVTSHFARQSLVYGELAYSLILKEVGCLFQTFYLVGEYLGLGPCALGGGAPAGRLARLCHTSELAEPLVGEFMLGPL